MCENKTKKLKKREWCYTQSPSVFDVHCDCCHRANTTWSEYEGLIWCFDCEKDTKGTGGIFDGPIPLNSMRLMGISFDRIRLSDMMVLKIVDPEFGSDTEIIYKESGKYLG